MGTGLRGELLAGQPVSAHASHQAHQQWMRNGPSSDGLERQQRISTVFTSGPERMGTGLLDDQLARQPASTHTWHQARQQRTTNGLSSDGLERQQRTATVSTAETPRSAHTKGGLKTPAAVMIPDAEILRRKTRAPAVTTRVNASCGV